MGQVIQLAECRTAIERFRRLGMTPVERQPAPRGVLLPLPAMLFAAWLTLSMAIAFTLAVRQ